MKQRWAKWFWGDWDKEPKLKLCSFAAQGVWMRMLCVAADHDPVGYVAIDGKPIPIPTLAKLIGGTVEEVEKCVNELEENGVFSRDKNDIIYSRRMVFDNKKATLARINGKLGGNPSLVKHNGNGASDNPSLARDTIPHAIPRDGAQIARDDRDNSSTSQDSSEMSAPKRALARESEDDKQIETEFAIWWSRISNKVGKGAARGKYAIARRNASAETLLDAWARYERTKPPDRQWVHPATWLQQERWLDEPAPPPTTNQYRATGPPDEGRAFRDFLRSKAEGR